MNNLNLKACQANLKIKHPCRTQVEMHWLSLDDRLPLDHKARAVWEFVEQMDTSILYELVASSKGKCGRKAVSPDVLLALWLYGITDGTVSAREISKRCKENEVYRWIAGGINIDRTTLAQFRSNHWTTFQRLLTESLAVMVKAGLLREEDFSQDGTRIKAAAGFNTFRSQDGIESLRQSMANLIKEIEKEERKTGDKKEKAALRRQQDYARKRLENAKRAADELKKHKENLERNARKNSKMKDLPKRLEKARASVVDPEVRKMKMGDGGFRLAYNVQFATGTDSKVIYGVDVVNTLDPGTIAPMISQVGKRLSTLGLKPPSVWLADTAYCGQDDLNAVYELDPNLQVLSPPNQDVEKARCEKKTDSEAVRRWRRVLGTDFFKKHYRKRCSTAEFSNMLTKAKGMGRVLVRGINKVLSVCILHAIAFNMERAWDLAKSI